MVVRNKLSAHLIPLHWGQRDFEQLQRITPASIKTIYGFERVPVDFWRASPKSLFGLRDHAMSEQHDDMFIDTEYFIFYFDYLACPYIDESIRNKMMEEVKKISFDNKKNPIKFDSVKLGRTVLKNDFLVAWRDPDYLKASLEKKEYIFSYS